MAITIDLKNANAYIRNEDALPKGIHDDAYSSILDLPFPDDTDGFFGKFLLAKDQVLEGKIIIDEEEKLPVYDDSEMEVKQVKAISLYLDEQALGALKYDDRLPLSLISDFQYQEEDSEIEENIDLILSEVRLVQDVEEEQEYFEYFILPTEEEKRDEQTRGGGEMSHEIVFGNINRDNLPDSTGERGLFGGGKRFLVRFMTKGVKNIAEEARLEGAQAGFQKEKLYDFIIDRIKQSKFGQKLFEQQYFMLKYNRKNKDFDQVNIQAIDPELKTLILVPGTFTQSFKKNYRKGSYHFLMDAMAEHTNWFDYLIATTDYEQIITLEHETVLHSIEENVIAFAQRLQLDQIRFKHPTAVIGSSRGGMLVKYLIRHQDAAFAATAPTNINLNAFKFVTVASGNSDYVSPAAIEKVKNGVELFLSIMNFITPGWKVAFGWLLSMSVEVIARMPGLMTQITGSPLYQELAQAKVDEVNCLPIANNHGDSWLSFLFGKLIDSILGEENDFVVEYNSQQIAAPGQITKEFGMLKGDAVHGKGLESESNREMVLRFLGTAIDTDTLT